MLPFSARLATLAWLVTLAMAAASCSSSKDSDPDFPDPDVAGRDANPDGVPYPTDHLGGADHKGTRPGDRIPNFTFQAYPDGDRTAGLRTVSLADYLDPQQKRHKILHIQIAATWCEICSSVALATIQLKEPLAKEGVVYLEIIVAGHAPTTGPSLGEVDQWVTSHQSNLTTAIDVRGRRLAGIAIERTVVPYDLLIDTRSMEILDSSAGAPVDIASYEREGLDYVSKNPPAY